MIARSWEDCRSEWEASETRLLLGPEQIQKLWANGRCGQCGQSYDDHQPLTEVSTADAVLATPYVPVDDRVAAYIRGEVILSRLTRAEFDALAALVHLIPDDYPVTTGGVR